MKRNKNHEKKDRADCIRKMLSAMYPSIKSPLYHTHDYEFVFAVILSAQTTDKQVNVVTEKLFMKYPSLQSIAAARIPSFQRNIASINLYKTKAKHIVRSAQILIETHEGKVPQTLDQLITLPGVGRKSANVVMSELWHKPEGIAVDTHVIRLSQKYGLSRHKDPIKIEKDLMKIIPKSEWDTFPLRLIQYGREYCPARCRKCPTCPLWKCVRRV
jgi:endonuclease-3